MPVHSNTRVRKVQRHQIASEDRIGLADVIKFYQIASMSVLIFVPIRRVNL